MFRNHNKVYDFSFYYEMNNIPIERWDGVLTACCGNLPKPVIYFLPDFELLSFIKRNGYRIRIIIKNTNSQYDGLVAWGTVRESTITGSCRPNYFDITQLYTITLDMIWNGYPLSLGDFSVLGCENR